MDIFPRVQHPIPGGWDDAAAGFGLYSWAMAIESPGVASGDGDVVSDPFVRRVAQSLIDDFPAAVDDLVERILAMDPFYASVAELMYDQVRDAVETNLAQLLRGLAGVEPLDFSLPRDLARRRAEQGVPVAALLHAYRLTGQFVWDRHVAAGKALADREFGVDEILDGAAQIWTLTNLYCEVVSQAYDDTSAERARRSERERTLLLDALFEGRIQDLPQLADVARLLDLPARGQFVVAVVENPTPGEDGVPGVEQALRFKAIRSAWRLRSQRHIGVVVIDNAPDGGDLDTLHSIVTTRATARVGISPPFSSLADTTRFVRAADLALSCLPPSSAGVAHFDDHPVGLLVAGSPDLAAHLAQVVLGPILELEADERDLLLETLQAWIVAGGSTTEASAALFCHRNTVRNRLQRIETLTGRSLSDPSAIAEICLAVKAVQIIPPDAEG